MYSEKKSSFSFCFFFFLLNTRSSAIIQGKGEKNNQIIKLSKQTNLKYQIKNQLQNK
jgi:hypothetical protein